MTEEKLTKVILNWLEDNAWEIICFDFPQSGTGIMLHPNEKEVDNKNKGGIIPDIVAFKGDIVVFFENKDRFVLEDYKKTNYLKVTDIYSESTKSLLSQFDYKSIFYGISIPSSSKNKQKDKENWTLIDFTLMVNSKFEIEIVYDPFSIFDS